MGALVVLGGLQEGLPLLGGRGRTSGKMSGRPKTTAGRRNSTVAASQSTVATDSTAPTLMRMSEIVDRLVGSEHAKLYQETDGELGYHWRGSEILLLTTVGTKSGRTLTTPLIFTTDGDNFVVVASKAGAPDNPKWFSNLQASGPAAVQVRADQFSVRLRVAEGEERSRLWEAMVASWPDYEQYQRKTARQIPVVVLERD